MDNFEYLEPPSPKRKRKSSSLVWNVLTILVLVTTLCVASVFFLIYVDPHSNINPFPPPTLFPSPAAPTITVTPRFTLVPSWTPTNTNPLVVSYPEATEIPVETKEPTPSPLPAEPTVTSPPGGYAFVVKDGSPSAIASSTFHPELGCDWSGVAGQATSLNGESLQGLFVQLGGSLPDTSAVENLAMTGLATQYGVGGFEFTLAHSLLASSGALWIQLLDTQSLPLSDRIYIDTYADCEKNLVIIQFDQVR
jgi:hypothetical protein